MRLPAAVGAVVLATAASTAVVALPASPACAGEGDNRVVVVVQTGRAADAPVTPRCVRFTEESISGAEALRRAGVDAVFKPYGGLGQFVCSILGVGPSYDDCPSTGQNWSYYRAPYPSTTFSYSSAGSSSTRVRDGDVEGWRFANAPPPHTSVVSLCGGAEPAARTSPTSSTTTTTDPPPPTTTTTTAELGSPAGPTGQLGYPVRTTSTSTSTTNTSTSTSTTSAPEAPATTSTVAVEEADGPEDEEEVAGAPVRARPPPGGGAKPSVAALLLFGSVLAVLAGWWWRARSR